MAVKLPGFVGLLKRELMPDFRVGTELSDRAKFWGRVGGIFHTDEMPNYGITAEEVEAVRKAVAAEEGDAVVFVADTPENVLDALKAVVERAQEALVGVPAETRTAKDDGTTRYMRPRPGAARMYPETDIPAQQITAGACGEGSRKPARARGKEACKTNETVRLKREIGKTTHRLRIRLVV